jgi:uncharacterized protein
MLNNDDRAAIQGLFSRLRNVERTADPRDPEAEALIGEEIARQPGAPYYMAQTILVQEHALAVAERRIEELEAEVERASRSDVFGGLFGGGDRDRGRARQRQDVQAQPGPWERQERYGGGGFLAGAAQTALGVTGGILLGSAIGSMFGAGAATAAEPQAEPQPAEPVEPDQSADADMGGDDFGDGGGFDTGGGFDFGGDF